MRRRPAGAPARPDAAPRCRSAASVTGPALHQESVKHSSVNTVSMTRSLPDCRTTWSTSKHELACIQPTANHAFTDAHSCIQESRLGCARVLSLLYTPARGCAWRRQRAGARCPAPHSARPRRAAVRRLPTAPLPPPPAQPSICLCLMFKVTRVSGVCASHCSCC